MTRLEEPLSLSALGRIEASQHTPAYLMHKFWARRPWPVFRAIIERFTKPGDIILDPFAGGGVTLVEGLICRRRVVAVDLNPLACYIMRHEVKPLDLQRFSVAVEALRERLESLMTRIYGVRCPNCHSQGLAEWVEYEREAEKPLQIKVKCPSCRFAGTKTPEPSDLTYIPEAQGYPASPIPPGDKTAELLRKGYKHFYELFTRRNLAALALIRREIQRYPNPEVRSFLLFAFSSALKWASKMSHRRGSVIEGWAMHAYWIYPKYLEINVWKQFLNRCAAVKRGKAYTNRHIGAYARAASEFRELEQGRATYMIIQGDSRRLPLPGGAVDMVITDPPYGGNVNYAELSDYFLSWLGETAPKEEEVIIHRTRGRSLRDYEEGLYEVFKECNRVLKEDGALIATFNSKDLRVVAAFLLALRRAGFTHLDTSYQPYLKTYETTFHAMQVDAMPFDFVFAFRKSKSKGVEQNIDPATTLDYLKEVLDRIMSEGRGERDYRLSTYPYMIEVINNAPEETVRAVVNRYEELIKAHSRYFKEIRRKTVDRRRNKGNINPGL